MIPAVPIAIGQVSTSPSQSTPSIAPKSGDVDARVVTKVGPRYRIPRSDKLADSAGRNNPIRTKISTAGCSQ